jgi:hypothetical protein
LSVCRWSAWAPGVTDIPAWHSWAEGETAINGPVAPDIKFVAPMARRRLSGLSRMVFRVSAECLTDEEESIAYVFCSRYGEYNRSFSILNNLANGEPASAAAFANSVHNTSASLFAIEKQDHAQSTAIAGCESTLEAGFMEAWSLLSNGVASVVLLVYHDEPLPNLYQGQSSTVTNSAAFAMLMCLPKAAHDMIDLSLSWGTRRTLAAESNMVADPALQVLKLLINGGGAVELVTQRLVWNWSASHEIN